MRLEQTLGRQIARSTDEAVDFVDSVLGRISLKGPIPGNGSVEGLAASVIRDAKLNTASQAIAVDTLGLSATQVSRLKTLIESGVAGATKRIIYLP